MITGAVNAQWEAVVRLQVFGTAGKQQFADAVLDTGFTGALTLPTSLIAALGLPWRLRDTVILGNGMAEEWDIHSATVLWDGVPRQVLVHASDSTPIVGTAFLANHDLRIRFVPGGSVEIEAVP